MGQDDCFERKLDKLGKSSHDNEDRSFAAGKIHDAISKAFDDVDDDLEYLGCYGEKASVLSRQAVDLSAEDLEKQLLQYQASFLANNMAFSRSLSETIDKFLERVQAHLRPFPAWIKQSLIGVESMIIERLQPLIEKYLEKTREFARRIGVQNFSISIGSGLLSFSFTFGV